MSEVVIDCLPTLLGAVVGGGVTLLATCMSIKKELNIRDKEIRTHREEEDRQFRLDVLIKLQDAIQESARVASEIWIKMNEMADKGFGPEEWYVDNADSMALQMALQEVLLYSYRIDDACLFGDVNDFRDMLHRVLYKSRTVNDLEYGMNRFLDAHAALLKATSEKIRGCAFGRES